MCRMHRYLMGIPRQLSFVSEYASRSDSLESSIALRISTGTCERSRFMQTESCLGVKFHKLHITCFQSCGFIFELHHFVCTMPLKLSVLRIDDLTRRSCPILPAAERIIRIKAFTHSGVSESRPESHRTFWNYEHQFKT